MDSAPGPADFEDAIGDTFTATDSAGPLPFVLESVERRAATPGAPRGEPFTLAFVAQFTEAMLQRIYTLAHDGLGSLDIFLVPIGPGADGRLRYEAVFN